MQTRNEASDEPTATTDLKADRLQQVLEAYRVLSDHDTRLAYIAQRSQGEAI